MNPDPWDDELIDMGDSELVEFSPVSDPFLMNPGGDAMFTLVPFLMAIIVIGFVVTVIVKLVKAGQTYATNSASPEQTVGATVVAKRTQTEGGMNDTPVRTLHFVTFQDAAGDRVELRLSPEEYGQLAEGDQGALTRQGTWYRRFERSRMAPLDGTWEAPGGTTLAPPPA